MRNLSQIFFNSGAWSADLNRSIGVVRSKSFDKTTHHRRLKHLKLMPQNWRTVKLKAPFVRGSASQRCYRNRPADCAGRRSAPRWPSPHRSCAHRWTRTWTSSSPSSRSWIGSHADWWPECFGSVCRTSVWPANSLSVHFISIIDLDKERKQD